MSTPTSYASAALKRRALKRALQVLRKSYIYIAQFHGGKPPMSVRQVHEKRVQRLTDIAMAPIVEFVESDKVRCPRCGDMKRRDSSCECALTEAEKYYGVQ